MNQQDIFYDTTNLSKPEIASLFRDAKEVCFNWWVDDCPLWQRRRIDMDFEKVIKLFLRTKRDTLHITIIHRMQFIPAEPEYLEIGFDTLSRKSKNGDIFLWIQVDIEHKNKLLNKYGIFKTL